MSAARAVAVLLRKAKGPEDRAALRTRLARMHELLLRLPVTPDRGDGKIGAALAFLKQACDPETAAAAGPRPVLPPGRHHDLTSIYEEVRARYFPDHPPVSSIRWSPRPSWTRLGYYETRTRAVVISRSMDDARVPREAVARVVFHEALHDVMGIGRRDGRRVMHPPAFKARERAFHAWEETETFFRETWPRLRNVRGF